MHRNGPNSISFIALMALMAICVVAIVALALNRTIRIETHRIGDVKLETTASPPSD